MRKGKKAKVSIIVFLGVLMLSSVYVMASQAVYNRVTVPANGGVVKVGSGVKDTQSYVSVVAVSSNITLTNNTYVIAHLGNSNDTTKYSSNVNIQSSNKATGSEIAYRLNYNTNLSGAGLWYLYVQSLSGFPYSNSIYFRYQY